MKCKNRKSKTTFKVKLKNKLYAIFQKVFIYLNKFKFGNTLKDKIIDIIKKYLIYIIKKNWKNIINQWIKKVFMLLVIDSKEIKEKKNLYTKFKKDFSKLFKNIE